MRLIHLDLVPLIEGTGMGHMGRERTAGHMGGEVRLEPRRLQMRSINQK